VSNGKRILFTGGNGLLGSEFKKIRPDLDYTDIEDFNITDYEQMRRHVQGKDYDLILHAAAFTSPPRKYHWHGQRRQGLH